MRIAAISDIHGNLPALEAVLDDVRRQGADLTVQLGDAFSGPLWPRETADLLFGLNLPCVRGNHDRALAGPQSGMGPLDLHAFTALSPVQLDWIRSWPMLRRLDGGVVLFHATPDDDDRYLLEDPGTGYAQLLPPLVIGERLGDLGGRLMLCGHSHVPRVVRLADDRTVVNAGSAGLPAYTDDTGGFHRHESGSPHARYALVELGGAGIDVSLRAVEYDWDAASRQARRQGRDDWARWLSTGRA